MSRVIVITSGKGGVGKTTTTSNIGMSLARSGYNTLVMDADVGLRNLDLLLGLENRIIYTALDVITGTCRLEQALIYDKRYNKLTFFPLSPMQAKQPITKEQLKEIIQLLKDTYEFILIDSPAGIDDGFLTAVGSAEEAIVVVTPEVPSIRDADKVIGILLTQGIKKISLLVNRIRPKMIETEDMMAIDDVEEILGIPLLGVIPDSEQVIIASNRGQPLVLGDNDNKISLVGLAFENTAQRLLDTNVELLNFDPPTLQNPVKRLFKNFLTKVTLS
jgi:septum site-determining protein MinD